MDSIPPHLSRHLTGVTNLIEHHRQLRGRYAALIRQSGELRTCIQCDNRYRPRDNMRARECWMHSGHIVEGRLWSCCGSPRDILGCISCMHTDSQAILMSMHRDPFNSYLELPAEVLDFGLVPFNPKIVENYPEGSASLEQRDGIFHHIRRVVV